MSRKQNKWCFVPGCKSTSFSTSDKIFVSLPQDYERKRKWFKAARRDMPKSRSKFDYCGDHFNLDEDVENYVQFKLMGGRIMMKKEVVPHIFDCQPDRKRTASLPVRSLPMKRRRKQLVDEVMASTSQAEIESELESAVFEDIRSGSSITIEPTHKDIGIQVSRPKPSFRSKSVQCNIQSSVKDSAVSPFKQLRKDTGSSPHVKFGALKRAHSPVASSSDTDDLESSASSFAPSTSWSDETENIAQPLISNSKSTIALIERAPKFYLGVPDSWCTVLLKLLCEKTKISKENIMLTLMKIKLNDSFFRLAQMFDMKTASASKIFAKSLIPLQHYLNTLIFWPPSEKIKYFLPIPFRARYFNVESIIDCLEIEIVKPSDPVKQALTWSEYKKCNTLKYLISSTPDGFISYISNGYGGRISDSLLVQTCGFLNVVPPGCSVMADRGFKDLAKYLQQKGCRLVRPPSVSSSTKPSKAEVIESKRIASLRIHIERVIRRVREFAYLKPHSVIHHDLISQTDAVSKIACDLINLQHPIIKQE